MKAAIWTFRTIHRNTVSPSTNIAIWLAKQTGLPLCWDEKILESDLDILLIVNGSFTFSKGLPVVAKAVLRAKRIIWLQNDYAIVPPKPVSTGMSPFRKAFRVRRKRGLPDIEYWTTVAPNAALPGGRYFNWNAFFYAPPDKRELRAKGGSDLFYYGYFRRLRQKALEYYLKDAPYPVTISSGSKEFLTYGVEVVPRMLDLRSDLRQHGLGLYVEDTRSHKEFHSPATRFYEMLGASLPIAFQPEAKKMLRRAGFDVRDFVARNAADIRYMLRHRTDIRQAQYELWCEKDYGRELRYDVRKALHSEGLL